MPSPAVSRQYETYFTSQWAESSVTRFRHLFYDPTDDVSACGVSNRFTCGEAAFEPVLPPNACPGCRLMWEALNRPAIIPA